MKKDIHHIHDKTYRSFFENKEIFLQLLASGMPIEQVMEITELNLETLKGLLP